MGLFTRAKGKIAGMQEVAAEERAKRQRERDEKTVAERKIAIVSGRKTATGSRVVRGAICVGSIVASGAKTVGKAASKIDMSEIMDAPATRKVAKRKTKRRATTKRKTTKKKTIKRNRVATKKKKTPKKPIDPMDDFSFGF